LVFEFQLETLDPKLETFLTERRKTVRRKRVCFVGYGSTEYSRKSEESQLGHYATAIRAALNQTGLKKKDIHGLSITTQASPDTAPHVAEQLGFELDWVLNADYGGASGVGAVSRAADAIECGHLDVALLVGGNSFDRSVAHQRPLEYQRGNFVDVYGYGGPNSLMALIQRLHMENFGTTLEQTGKIAVAQRFNAINNPQALFREPMTMQDYLNSRMISDPIRLFDCVMPCSGAECLILASEEKAQQITDKLVYLVTDAEKVHYQVANMLPEKTTFGMKLVGEKIFSEVKREDIDLFEIYDDYPIAVMIQIEDFGYCKKGDGGKFVDAHDLTYNGDFPVNTGGGELSVGQAGLAGGFLHVVEALRQLRGEADGHQVKKAERALVTGIGWLNYGRNLGTTAALVMERRK
jgi:acetyl-CoA acetyltransferase